MKSYVMSKLNKNIKISPKKTIKKHTNIFVIQKKYENIIVIKEYLD